MGYKKIGPIRQLWYMVKYAIHSWIEWQDAKCWAKPKPISKRERERLL